jgi:hypothetical protein
MQNPLSEYNPEMEMFESESEFEWSGEGEVIGEGEVMELAAELLEVRDEQRNLGLVYIIARSSPSCTGTARALCARANPALLMVAGPVGYAKYYLTGTIFRTIQECG